MALKRVKRGFEKDGISPRSEWCLLKKKRSMGRVGISSLFLFAQHQVTARKYPPTKTFASGQCSARTTFKTPECPREMHPLEKGGNDGQESSFSRRVREIRSVLLPVLERVKPHRRQSLTCHHRGNRIALHKDSRIRSAQFASFMSLLWGSLPEQHQLPSAADSTCKVVSNHPNGQRTTLPHPGFLASKSRFPYRSVAA